MSISCIAIDDDQNSLENLVSYIEKLPELELVQTFTEPLEALAEISVSNPVDIIFIDIEMPSISGIELAGLVRKKAKYLIFTTAHTRYALDAFEVEADAYLLKPYSIIHFAKAINSLYPAGLVEETSFPLIEDQFFYLPAQDNDNSLIRVDLNDIISIEHQQQNINFITLDNSFSSSKIEFAKLIKSLTTNAEFIQISDDVTISKQHIISVLGDHILLANEISYKLTAPYQQQFAAFIESNRQKI